MSHWNQSPNSPRGAVAKEKEGPYTISTLIRWEIIYSLYTLSSFCPVFSTRLLLTFCVGRSGSSSPAFCGSLFQICPLFTSPRESLQSGQFGHRAACAGHCSRFVCVLQHRYQWVADKLQQPLLFILTFFRHFWILAKECSLSWFGVFKIIIIFNLFLFIAQNLKVFKPIVL